MKEEIEDFLNGNDIQLKLVMTPISNVTEILEPLGYEEYEYDSNGWEVDFWQTYINENQGNKKIELSGSLFYGNFTLSKK